MINEKRKLIFKYAKSSMCFILQLTFHQVCAIVVESDHIIGGLFIEWLIAFFFGEQNNLKKNEKMKSNAVIGTSRRNYDCEHCNCKYRLPLSLEPRSELLQRQ